LLASFLKHSTGGLYARFIFFFPCGGFLKAELRFLSRSVALLSAVGAREARRFSLDCLFFAMTKKKERACVCVCTRVPGEKV
jgi:hypothetical protein